MKRIDKIKAWMKKHNEDVGVVALMAFTGAVLYGAGYYSGQVDLKKEFKNHIPKVVNLSGFLGSYATYGWLSKNVPEAKKMMDDFADKNPELSDISKLFYEYREIKELLS